MKTQDEIRIQSHKDPAQLEREIDQQRNHIAELVEALGQRLSPGEMFERVLGYGKGGGREFAGNLGQTVKSNPVPALLTAAGMLWLYNGSRHPSGASTSADVGTHREGTSERIQGMRRTAHDAADSARYRAQRANEGLHHMLEDNPMAVGAMGVAAGALLGAMLPVTRKEHELMGEASDRLTREAREIARGGPGATARSRGDATPGDVGQRLRPGAGTDTDQSFQRPSST